MQPAGRVLVLVGVAALLAAMAVGRGDVAAQQQPTRLLVNNNTGTVVELFAVTRQGAQSRGRVNPGSSLPVYNVSNGDRFRAVWKGAPPKEWEVRLTFDRSYGGWQAVMNLP